MRLLGLVMLAMLVLSACAPKTPTPTPAAAQEQPAPANEPSPPTPTPAAQTIDLLGPQRGTSMLWVDGSTLVFVPEGVFTMGHGGEDNPEHEVYLSDFWIYRAEVTNQQYALCVAAGKCSQPGTENAMKRLTDSNYREHPVAGVDWAQSEAYCQWVDGRLPTEAQWEKTARGPEGNLYPWGEGAPACELGNFNDCTGQTSKVDEHPQGKSYYEALGTAGNVFEWVADWYKAQYYSESPERDPLGPQVGDVRSVRSSSYVSPLDDLRPSKRFYLAPDQTRADLGFRCVIEAPRYYPPFCETRIGQPVPETPGQPGSSGTTSGISASGVGRGCGFATADISGGTIQSVEASGLTCEFVGGTRVYCSGPDSATGSVTVCVQGEQETLPTVIGTCPPGYTPDPSDPTRCGYIPGVQTATEITCFGETCLAPAANESGGCGPGAYFDTLAERCVSYGQPGGDCLPGYEFDTQALCCHSNSGEYPGCFSTEQCLPGGTSNGSNCIEFSLSMGACPKTGGGNSCGGLNMQACASNSSCYWDTGMNRCVAITP
jgi:formylglycine-generating enzyme required for sulfatase activity